MNLYLVLSVILVLVSIYLPLKAGLSKTEIIKKYRYSLFSLSSMVLAILIQAYNIFFELSVSEAGVAVHPGEGFLVISFLIALFVIMLNFYVYSKTKIKVHNQR